MLGQNPAVAPSTPFRQARRLGVVTTYQCRGEGNQSEDEGPAEEDVSQWTDEQEASSISCLHQRSNGCGLLEGDIKSVCYPVQDGLIVIQVGHSEGGGLFRSQMLSGGEQDEDPATITYKGEKKIERQGELGRIIGVVPGGLGLPFPCPPKQAQSWWLWFIGLSTRLILVGWSDIGNLFILRRLSRRTDLLASHRFSIIFAIGLQLM